MRESFLHFLWRWRRFHLHALCTTQGQPLEILHPGEWNTHAGPDFFNARIRLGDTLWAGNVEIHLRSSDWMLHGHQRDPAYDNVVLHVVLEEDLPAMHTSGERIPCLELKERIPANILEIYQRLEQERQVPPGLRMDQRSWQVPQVRRPGHRKDQQVPQRELPELAQHQGQEPLAQREQELDGAPADAEAGEPVPG